MGCGEEFQQIEPKEIIVKICALSQNSGGLSITPAIETLIHLDDEQWFEGGINIKYTNLRKGNNNIQILLEASPILALGFFIRIEQNFISRKVYSIYEPPNYRFVNGILFNINFHYGDIERIVHQGAGICSRNQ